MKEENNKTISNDGYSNEKLEIGFEFAFENNTFSCCHVLAPLEASSDARPLSALRTRKIIVKNQ